ncbi:MAG: hypothetical protein IH828_01215 [Nitrospinae bacterium]|nr:hypothetical protein [Nitrospinota bacterium]
MAQPVRVTLPNGEESAALELDFDIVKEDWNTYATEDGTSIKIKLVVTKVTRIEGKYDEEGNPLYLVKSNNMVVAAAPDHLRKRASGE